MTSLVFALMLQYVVSTKAGMVNHIQGDVNVKSTESVAAGIPIRTGSNGYAEILLNPGTFLRLGQNSEAVLDSVDLTDVVVRTVAGASIIEVTEIDQDFPITVATGDLTVQILQSGLYRFEDGNAAVLSGKLRVKNSKAAYKKGWAVSNPAGGYRARKLIKSAGPTALETWSRQRSNLIANANVETVQSFKNDLPLSDAWRGSAWMWAPGLGAWTFMPASRTVSPYGSRYRAYRELQDERNSTATNPDINTSGRSIQPSSNSTNSANDKPSPPPERLSRDEYFNRKEPPAAESVVP